jgi:hypothetical protein
MKLIDLRKVRLITKTSVAAAKQPRIDLPIFGISIGTEQSTGDTSRVNEAAEYSDHDEYIMQLWKKHKLKPIAEGQYANVYQHPTHANVVVKISHNDVPYIKYLKWAEKQHGNPYLPHVLSLHEYKDEAFEKGEVFHIVFMEKLYPPSKKDVKNFLLHSGLYEIGIDAEEFGNVTDEDLEEAMKSDSIDPKLKSILTYIRRSPYAFDIHDQNFMVRKGGQLVLTDPTSHIGHVPK